MKFSNFQLEKCFGRFFLLDLVPMMDRKSNRGSVFYSSSYGTSVSFLGTPTAGMATVKNDMQ